MHGGDRDCDRMEPIQVRRDPAGAEVIVLAQIEDFADDVARGGPRRTPRYPCPIAQACVAVLGAPPFPLVERLARNPKATAHAGDVSVIRRLL